jgi:hypothetical protein
MTFFSRLMADVAATSIIYAYEPAMANSNAGITSVFVVRGQSLEAARP